LSCDRVVYRVEKSKGFDGRYLRERSWFKVIQKIYRVFQNPHVIYATTRVNSFTIFLLSLFYCRQNLCQVNRQFFRRNEEYAPNYWRIRYETLFFFRFKKADHRYWKLINYALTWARPNLFLSICMPIADKKNITAINQSESSILI
jgi:hypothetical protein